MMPSTNLEKVNIKQWIKDNEKQFVPPVCNKLMRNDQLTIMFVGGPNIRKDYHFEEGEEVFYQIKGDMCLKVLEHNQHRDIIIKEGEIFLLPAFIPHSPNRFENSVGLVLERKRHEDETDCLRYYQENSNERLYERWFHTEDLGIQLVPVIKEFFASEEYRTGKPKSDSFPPVPPLANDDKAELGNPFLLNERLKEHEEELSKGKMVSLFDEKFQTRVYAIGKGEHSIDCSSGDVWLWQHKGHSEVTVINNDDQETVMNLKYSDSLYLSAGWKCQLKVDEDGLVLSMSQDPRRKQMIEKKF